MVPEDVAIDVHVKRRLVSPATYKRGLVKHSNILAWLKHLQHTPLYRAINVRFDWSRLDYFDGDETAERKREEEEEELKEDDADDDIETIPQDFDVNDPLQLAIALNAVSKTIFFNEEGDDGPGVDRIKKEEEREQEQRERERDANAKKKKKPRVRIVMNDGRERTENADGCDEAETARKLADHSHSLHVAPGSRSSWTSTPKSSRSQPSTWACLARSPDRVPRLSSRPASRSGGPIGAGRLRNTSCTWP
ncbi:hypothetical protein HPB49_009277 [Dermacentor silvarum]|uniref:Uncharacterized protein n=1 Tax=Dermacentor silvarum TaxID=543639 RepID=A0ACB8CKA4_DERSI|nr:hypothetical protein HPB49_009277 [Dermacentor silvarum]